MKREESVNYRVAINAMSISEESEVLYLFDEHFNVSSLISY